VSKQDELKEKILKAQQESDIASLYVLEQEAQDNFDDETLHGFYANILDLALERLTQVLEAPRKFDMNDVQDFATLRALYEYAIEHYSAKKVSDASALFEVLSGVSNDEAFSKALKFHWAISANNIEFDDFLDNFADLEKTQSAKTFYISHFTKKAQEILDSFDK